jgi:putative aldouronate transport system permease protein
MRLKDKNAVTLILLSAMSVLILLPLWYMAAVSFSRDADIAVHGYSFIPRAISLTAYRQAFAVPKIILNAYGVTALVTVLGTFMSLMLTTALAYTLSRRDYAYRKFTSVFALIPLLFNGGMVSQYLINTQVLRLNDTIWALMLPYGVNVWFTFMMRSFLSGHPAELYESAKIDGAGEYRIYFTIALPLSSAGLATIGLFYAFAFWNDWWLAMLYINKRQNLAPLQMLLQRIMMNIEFYTKQLPAGIRVEGGIPLEGTRMALAVLAAGPMLIAFPFFQRFFIKGISVGAVKG